MVFSYKKILSNKQLRFNLYTQHQCKYHLSKVCMYAHTFKGHKLQFLYQVTNDHSIKGIFK